MLFYNMKDKDMIITTSHEIPNRKIKQSLGIVSGNTVRAKDIFRDIGAAIKNLIGGEVKSYTAMITEARTQAYERMVESAKGLKADAIINVRFTTSSIANGASEILAYGTAVRL